MSLPPLPQSLKSISHYLKTAKEHESRDNVVSYYCRLYAVQKGLEIDSKSKEGKEFLLSLMSLLEETKSKLKEDEAIRSEVVGQAHVESYAMKVFEYADNEDRALRFNKNVVKSFYTAGLLFDVLATFGEPSVEVEQKKKYAKWKALYINKCFKEGTTPIPGPMANEDEFGEPVEEGATSDYPKPGPSIGWNVAGVSTDTTNNSNLIQPPGAHAPPSTPQEQPLPRNAVSASANTPSASWVPTQSPGNVSLTPQQYQKAMKYCKYASSALQYEDSSTAVDNLNKALQLITTGQDS